MSFIVQYSTIITKNGHLTPVTITYCITRNRSTLINAHTAHADFAWTRRDHVDR